MPLFMTVARDRLYYEDWLCVIGSGSWISRRSVMELMRLQI
jgi:hypothetical protein